MDWYRLDIETVCATLDSSPDGLASSEAEKRLEAIGPNVIERERQKSLPLLFLSQFTDFMILVLIAAALVAGAMGEVTDTLVIMAIVLLNGIVGFVQEYRAERTMEALRKMGSATAEVIRDGRQVTIPADHIVPGDVVVLQAGNVVPADLRLIDATLLRIEEAALTGESTPAEKSAEICSSDVLPLGDRHNLAYRGTAVASGRGSGIAIATGMATELGKIAGMLLQERTSQTPLQQRLARFGRKLSLAVLFACLVILTAGLLRGEQPFTMLLTAISLAVAAIPEALPAVVTISLALGAGKMARQNTLVRNLPAVETLGSVTHICTDKTGTLTFNRMTVSEVFTGHRLLKTGTAPGADGAAAPLQHMCLAMALCNDVREGDDGAPAGDPTEVALYVAARSFGYEPAALRQDYPRVAELPFDAGRKCMTTFHRSGREVVSFTKGAPEVVLARCEDMLTSSGRVPLDRREADQAAERMTASGHRVLAIAMRRWQEPPARIDPAATEQHLTFLGLAGMLDPPRDEAAGAVATCIRAGIIPVMITGDHPLTARNIAGQLGIADDGTVMTGNGLVALSLEDFERQVEAIRVYARVEPAQKLKIVKALQDRGCFVAMTGDGVNDAPALKRADIGVAMGMTGTDVAREASDMILLDDNFATIVTAVREGRRIFDNIRKFVKYVMSGNSGEIWTIVCAPFLGLPLPLLPIHLLWINLVTDGLPGIALATEPAERNIMERPPRPPRESFFAHGLGAHIIWAGLLMGSLSLLTQGWAIRQGKPHWQTMVFTVLCLSQMAHSLAIRSERDSLFRQGLLTNRPLAGAVLLTVVLQLALIYTPFLNRIFRTQPLPLPDLLLALALSSTVFLAVEAEKWLRRKRAGRRVRRQGKGR
ncbi:cation-translocating P-type ATPase [Geobacter sp. SVR]|uniref:cation-translocating P-type ATPase n=1 Tax=Geobacter sp. SVR TaxID=2495594 RepID=UPI00143EFA19|nr:cation-translocating P-type ATPase [Geobacter sp. SVR]BCS52500.1 ATPase [Geobacter sp. SVR]GCF84063.1 ATPase [Geobacter sp. SVR]